MTDQDRPSGEGERQDEQEREAEASSGAAGTVGKGWSGSRKTRIGVGAGAATGGWRSRPGRAPNLRGTSRTGRGIAAVRYEGSSSWVSAVITVTVDTASGAVTSTQVVIAHDCGVVINPDGLVNQIQGNLVQ